MKTQRQKKLARQLEAISDRANRVTRMVNEGADCIEVLCRLQAMRTALIKIKMELLEDYFEQWTAALIQSNEPDQCKHILKRLLVLFEFVEGLKRQP